ncbi:S8 family serine peptidase [Candidatus Sumerlaeota bacterium]|nr:S8 family serine peptidase [Candidatus Sumerlaeota bacterium]
MVFLLGAPCLLEAAGSVDLLVTFVQPVSAEHSGSGHGYKFQSGSAGSQSADAMKWLAGRKVLGVEPVLDSVKAVNSLKSNAPVAESTTSRIIVESKQGTADVIREVSALRGVVHVEENQRGHLLFEPPDPLYPQQKPDFQPINLETAWGLQSTPGASSSVRVAVIDSGIEAVHGDFAGAIDPASHNVAEGNASLYDDMGHGSRVAGIIGARSDSQTGIAGVAFGCTLVIYDVRRPATAPEGSVILLSDVVSAINRAAAPGPTGGDADIINISLAFNAESVLLEKACKDADEAGALIVAAAGNDNQGDHAVYPASYECVLGVGGLDEAGTNRAEFSNFNGATKKLSDIFAPASTIFSTIPGAQHNGTSGASGTSFAAPMVAGAAALLKTEHPEQSGRAIRAHLLATASPILSFTPSGGGGFGRLDVAAALATPMNSQIEIAGTKLTDTTDINPSDDDGVLDEGEKGDLFVSLTPAAVGLLSGSAGDAINVTGVLSTASSDIQPIATSVASFGNIVHGESATNLVAFGPIKPVAGAPAQKVEFQLALTGDNGFSANLLFELPLEKEFDTPPVMMNYAFSAGTTYHVDGDLSFLGTTTIPAGTIFKVDPGIDIRVHTGGVLTAIGTGQDPIVFTSSRPAQDLSVLPPFGTANSIGPRTEPVDLSFYVDGIIYVDANNGSDVIRPNIGTKAAPYKSLTMALQSLPQGRSFSSAKKAVLVAEGRYTGVGANPVFATHFYQIFGGYNPQDWTRDIYRHPSIIDGENLRLALRADGVDGGLDGFVITRGTEGGVVNKNGLPAPGFVLSNCIIINNQSANGAGLNVDGNFIVRNCIFANNMASIGGGAISTSTAGSGSIISVSNTFFLNNAAPYATACDFWIGTFFENNFVSGHSGVALSCVGTGAVLVDNTVFQNNAGTAVKVESTSGVNTRIFNNTFSGNGMGIDAARPTRIINNILWENGTELSASSSTIQYNLIEDGYGGSTNTVTADPEFPGVSARGLIQSLSFDAVSNLSQATLSEGSPFQEGGNAIIQIDGIDFMLSGHGNDVATIVGDPTAGGTKPLPLRWSMSLLRIGSGSPAVDAGIAASPTNPAIPSTDLDGEARTGLPDLGADESAPSIDFEAFHWGTFTFSISSTSSVLKHVIIENGSGVVAQSPNVQIEDTLFQNHDGTGFSTALALGSAILSSESRNNSGGGFDTPLTDVSSSRAIGNFGIGINGDGVDGSEAADNGLGGIVATTATNSLATGNGGEGFLLDSGGSMLVARANTLGIVSQSGDISNSEARTNFLDGITAVGNVLGCISSQNGRDGIVALGATISNSTTDANAGFGITGSGTAVLEDSRVTNNAGGSVRGVTSIDRTAIAGNGSGIAGVGQIDESYVAYNATTGVDADQISNSSIVGNKEDGTRGFTTLTNSWVVGNERHGAHGTSGVGTITNSSILRNGGSGTRNILSATASNIFGNGGFDAEDDVATGFGVDRDLHGNYWGVANTAEVLASPAEYSDYSFIRDDLDDAGNPGIYFIHIWDPGSPPVATAPVPNAPTQAPPGFVLAVTPNMDNPVNVGPTEFLVEFSRAMDVATTISVTFDLQAPYSQHVVDPSPGWVNATTWRGEFWIESDTGDTTNTLRIASARDSSGFLIPDDTGHQFVIDTTDPDTANNGQATATGSDMFLFGWPTANPLEYQGFHVRRSVGGADRFERINTALIPGGVSTYLDPGLLPNTRYDYIVDVVDLVGNSTQWTVVFGNTTNVGSRIVEWNVY